MHQMEVSERGKSASPPRPNAGLGAKALWRMCDLMWRAAGDTSTDHNWYTKRMILAGVYFSTLSIWLEDESEGFEETLGHFQEAVVVSMNVWLLLASAELVASAELSGGGWHC